MDEHMFASSPDGHNRARAPDSAHGGRRAHARGLAERPVRSEAESFPPDASCRIEVADVDGPFGELERAELLHPTARDRVSSTGFGTREVHTP